MNDMMIGELSRQTNVNIETIRYYERIGILPEPRRTESGRRVYDAQARKHLSFVRRCRELGFSLDAIRDMLQMVARGSVTCDRVRDLATAHLQDVRSKIADLRRMETILDRTVSTCGGGSGSDCPILDALYPGNADER